MHPYIFKAANENRISYADSSCINYIVSRILQPLFSAAFKFGFIKIPPLFLPKTLDKTLKKCGASRLLIKKALFIPAQPASIF